jgi:hypothetical protein
MKDFLTPEEARIALMFTVIRLDPNLHLKQP